MKLTTAQATVKFLSQQFTERDQKEYKFINGVWGIFGHGNVAGIGEALEQIRDLKHFLLEMSREWFILQLHMLSRTRG